MYKVTFIRMTDKGPKTLTVTSPNRQAAEIVHDALRLAGVHVRLWDGNKILSALRLPEHD